MTGDGLLEIHRLVGGLPANLVGLRTARERIEAHVDREALLEFLEDRALLQELDRDGSS